MIELRCLCARVSKSVVKYGFPVWGLKWWRFKHAQANFPGLSLLAPRLNPYLGRAEDSVKGLHYVIECLYKSHIKLARWWAVMAKRERSKDRIQITGTQGVSDNIRVF